MKFLNDGVGVTSASYYYLLEWNEKNNKKFISEKFNKHRLCELDKEEYLILWLNATTDEFNKILGLS
jgi:hypothetical protein